MPIPGVNIYACSPMELEDVLESWFEDEASFHHVEIGVAKEGQFGLGVDKECGRPLFHSQSMDGALDKLNLREGAFVVLFYSELNGVVGPTEVGKACPSIRNVVYNRNAPKDYDLGSIRPGPVWF